MPPAGSRKAPPTHPTVWIGLGLSAVGLLVATFAYSGTRVYDIVYAVVALVGAVLALAGILLAAWGRAIMSVRAQRSRRATMSTDTMKLQDALGAQPPTVAAPRSKRSFALSSFLPAAREKKEPAEKQKGGGSVFAFRAKPAAAAEAGASPRAAMEAPTERLQLECPECSARFSAEGRRPFVATCPHCGHAETVP